jgi:hypothetical protein
MKLDIIPKQNNRWSELNPAKQVKGCMYIVTVQINHSMIKTQDMLSSDDDVSNVIK